MTRIFITGGNGFIGSHLINELLQRDYDVHALIRHHPKTVNLPREVTTYMGDLLDIYFLKKIIRLVQPEYIIHLAAMTPVRYSFENPFVYAKVNLIGTMHMTTAAKESSVLRKFIHASTAEIYRADEKKLIKETDELYGSTPYGVSKVAADYWIRTAGDCYGLPYIMLRPSNTYFRKTEKGYFVEKVITTMLLSNELKMNGTPEAVRDWMFLYDHIQGYIKALESDVINEVFNISTGVGTSVGDVVELVKLLLDWKGKVSWGVRPRPNEPKYLVLDNNKAKKMIKFNPQYSLTEGLKIVINYWRDVLQ